MALFRPSCRVRLQLRLDEGADVVPLRSKLVLSPPTGQSLNDPLASTSTGLSAQLSVVNAHLRTLGKQRHALPAVEYDRLRARYSQQRDAIQQALSNRLGSAPLPNGITTGSPDDRVILGSILPRSVEIKRMGLRRPDEFECMLDFADAPIDPRVVRACFVDLDLGVASPEDYQLGMTTGATRDDGSLLSLVERGDPNTVLQGVTKFIGFADLWDVRHDENGGSVVVIRGRDLTAGLMARRLNSGESLDLQLPIARAVQQLVDASTLTATMKVVFGSPGDVSRFGPILADAIPAARKSRRGKKGVWIRSGDAKMSVWDAITSVCMQVGLIPKVIGTVLYLIQPNTFFNARPAARQLVYGRNLNKLEFNRKLGGVKVPSVEVRCYDPTIGRVRWARAPGREGVLNSGIYGVSNPPRAERPNEVSPQGAAEDKIELLTVKGINDGKVLEQTADAIFQQIGRQEIEGLFETSEISSWDSPEEGDLLNLLSGDSVEMLIARPMAADTTGSNPTGSPITTTVQQLQAMSVAARAQYLIGLGWKPRVAQQLAQVQELTAQNTTFRVRSVAINWNSETGVKISADFINFIVLRELAGDQSSGHGPSAAMEAVTGGRSGAAADAVRSGSAAQREATQQRADGKTSSAQYAEQGAAATQAQRANVRRFRQQ